MKRGLFIVLTVLLLVSVAYGVPVIKQLPFSKTTNLTPATYTFKFSLWDASTGGTSVWSEEKPVKMTSSTLKTNLGTVTPLDTVEFSQQLWVQVERNNGGVYTVVGASRTRLALAPYALWSETSEVTGHHTHDAVDVTGGTLNNSYFSAYSDLTAEGYLDNNAGTDLLTRSQADTRYVNENQETDPQVGTLTNGQWCSTDGLAVNCVQEPPAPASHNHNSSYVNVTGDKMSGVLNLPLDGLIAGEDQLVLSNGRVGIGTADPKDDLHVAGPGYLQAVFESTDSSGGIQLVSGNGQKYELQSLTDGGFILYDRNDSRNVLKVNTAGNVGIGTIWPGAKLDVSETSGSLAMRAMATAANSCAIEGRGKGLGARFYDSDGSGIAFLARSDNGVDGYGNFRGVQGIAAEDDGTGVYGSGRRGGVFVGPGYNGFGVIGEAPGDVGFGVSGSGGYADFYAYGPGTDYMAFTGAHEVKLVNDFPLDAKQGMIVSVTGDTQICKLDDGRIDISSTLPTVQLSARPNDKAVLGVFVSETPLHEGHWYKKKEGERFGAVNALGEGRVWVSNINGNIETGDYITTSVIPGYGQRQNDDLLHNYTLGKATENVDWDSVTETVEFKGKTYKVHLIAVVYTSG